MPGDAPGWRGAAQRVLRRLGPTPVRQALMLLLALVALAVYGGYGHHWGHAPQSVAAVARFSHDVPVERQSIRAGLVWVLDWLDHCRPATAAAAGKMRDMLVLLGSAAIGLPLMQRYGVASKVLGFLAIGVVIGPSGLALISDIHWSETLAEAGIIFFLCEMGLELSFDRLSNMKRDVFGLGLAQFTLTTVIVFFLSSAVLGLSNVQAWILGTAVSLSSSAFALQLLDESKERGTLHGRSAFGILLFQDLVVPLLLVLLPMLSVGSGPALLSALSRAGVNALLAVSPLILGGQVLLGKVFSFVAEARNTVAVRAFSFFTVLGTCYLFQIFSLSNTLGAFMAGVVLAETAYRDQVEAVISPIREDLLGLFFITVGFGIDLSLVITRPLLIVSAISALLLCKATVIFVVCRLSGLSSVNSQQVGLLLCQGGEFSFVMFTLAKEACVFTSEQAKLLLTVTSISMACTPFLSRLGRDISKSLQEDSTTSVDDRASEMRELEMKEKVERARVVVCGFGKVGTLITELLDTKFVPWVAFDDRAEVVTEAQGKDLPVFQGMPPEGLLNSRKVAVITPADVNKSKEIVQDVQKAYPDASDANIIVRATAGPYAQTLREWGVMPIVPGLAEDTLLMNLPIGATVLESLGYSREDAESVIDDMRVEFIAQDTWKDKHKVQQTKSPLRSLVRWYEGEQQGAEEALERVPGDGAEDAAAEDAAAAPPDTGEDPA